MQVPARMIGCLAVLSLVLGCDKSSATSAKSPNKTIWVDGTEGPLAYPETFGILQVYASNSEGGSLAIVVPFTGQKSLHKGYHDSAKPPNRIYVSPAHGAVFHNDRKILDFPLFDNRCYVLGKDLQFHDTGQSAKWVRGIPPEMATRRSTNVDVPQDPSGRASSTPAIQAVAPTNPLKVPPSYTIVLGMCKYIQKTRAYEEYLRSQAFDRDNWILCPPWSPLQYDGNEWRIDPKNDDGRFELKWEVLGIMARPADWVSAYPRDDWEDLLKPIPDPSVKDDPRGRPQPPASQALDL